MYIYIYGLYRDNGKEHGNYYSRVIAGLGLEGLKGVSG